MKLFIKNMVCNRCIIVVRQVLERSGARNLYVSLGEVNFDNELNKFQLEVLAKDLEEFGFEILDDQKQQQIEKIKTLLITKVQGGTIEEHLSLRDFFSQHIHKDYSQLSRLFSEVEGITMEQFFILQKIEKVKEWITYERLTLSEIAWNLGYSSVAHLSAQFKKVTGMTPSNFKRQGQQVRKALDKI